MLREFAAGGTVFKKFPISKFQFPNSETKTLWLVTRSAPSKEYPESYWRLPKGWLDDEDNGKSPGPLASGKIKATEVDLQKAAVREVAEEGGITAKIIEKITTDKVFYFNKNRERVLKFVTYYLMERQNDLPEGFGFETSETAWLPFAEALAKLKHKGEKEVLQKAKELLESPKQGNLI